MRGALKKNFDSMYGTYGRRNEQIKSPVGPEISLWKGKLFLRLDRTISKYARCNVYMRAHVYALYIILILITI